MKTFKYLHIVLLILFISSCDKHEIEYMTDPVGEETAEIQLHYFVPLTTGTANDIHKVEINNELYANSSGPLYTYNAIPSGSVGRFFTVKAGNTNIKLYKGVDLEFVYDKNVTLKAGKQNVFVYDFDKEPIVFDNEFPYSTNISEDTDKTCWVRFYNFLYEKEGVPTDFKLQYQYQYIMDIETGEKSEWLNLGNPVAFGETTGFQPVPVIKSVFNSSGYARIDYKIKVQDETGAYTKDLQLWNSNGAYVNYSDYWNGYIGRRYHHVFGGMRSAKPVASVRQFTAL